MKEKELLQLCYNDFLSKKGKFDKMYSYYIGDTDANKDYKMVTSRSNTIISVNYLKKFILEEVSYSIGNDINYIALDGNDEALEDIRYYMAHIKADHDVDLFKDMLLYSYAYELYSFDNDSNFNMSVLTPNECYAYEGESGEIELFFHFYKKRFTKDVRIKVYDKQNITFYNDKWEVLDTKRHKFSRVPVSLARVSDELEDNSLYKDIKGLQDAYETNLSDISNEISDFRNAYLKMRGVQVDDKDLPKMKEQGIMQFPDGDGDADWLIKNINDSFIQNTLNTIEEKMYQVSNHINYNEEMPSASSLALKARLISLETKCKLNEKAFSNCVQERIRFLFEYIEFITAKEYVGDYRQIKIRFTANIPSDDLLTAQMIQSLDGKISNQTALSLLSFVENPESEMDRLEEEQEAMYGSDLFDFDAEEDGIDEQETD